jgi:hypothetical protein
MRVPAAGANRKFAVFGALDDATGQVHWQLSRRKGREAVVSFLDQLRQTWPEENLVVVLDNVGYHKSRQTSDWWSRGPHPIWPLFLPADSPEWHLRERVWRTVKDPWSCHRWWADWQALGEATATRLAHLNARSHRGKGRALAIGHNCCASA